MGKILSQDEIDALLQSAQAPEPELGRAPEVSAGRGAVLYNFRRPDRVSKDQIRSLHFIHDRFARNVATSLSAFLRVGTDTTLVSIEQFTYSEFLMSLADPTVFYAIALQPGDAVAALELSPPVAFAMIDRMLGGTGEGVPTHRALTEIEQNVMDGVIQLVLGTLGETWHPVVDVQFKIHARDTRPQMLQVAAPNEIVALIVCDIKIGDVRGMLNLCVPVVALEATGAKFDGGLQRVRRAPSARDRENLSHALSAVAFPITARLKAEMPAREVLSLAVGDVLSLGRTTHEPVEISVGGVPKFRGQLVHSERGAGMRIDAVLGGDALRRAAEVGA